MKKGKIGVYSIIVGVWLILFSGCATLPRGRIEVKGDVGKSYQVGVEVETEIPVSFGGRK